MQLSSLIGKRIVSPAGEQLGYVTGAYLSRDLKTLMSLTAADGEEEEFFLPVCAIKSVSDAVIATRRRLSSPSGVRAPIGLHAYSEKGDDLGVVGDWLFGDCEPVFILVKEGVRTGYAADRVLSEENVIVYLSGERPAPKRHGKRPKESEREPSPEPQEEPVDPQEEPPAEPQEPSPTALPTEPSPPAEPSPVPSPAAAGRGEGSHAKRIPARLELGSRDLLGKRVVRSVFDAHGEIVALAGDRITPEVLSRARRKGRLLALTVNTLTNIY